MPLLNFGGISKAIKESFSRGSIFLIRQVHKSNEINMTLPKDASKRIVWVDLEMTGLDVSKDHILEMSCLITDAELEVVAKGPSLIIHQPDEILKNMSKWCIEHHGESGLTEASRKSKITLQDAEQRVLKFVSVHVPKKKCPLGGNSVYMDRLFINKYMPNFNDYLHYRIIDVSSVKELARRWYPEEYEKQPPKMFKHRTLDDIMESIKELKYYKENVFKKLHDAESVVG